MKNLFKTEDIAAMYSFLAIESPSNWWAYKTGETNKEGFSEVHEVYMIEAGNKGERDAMYANAFTSFKQNKFSYSYSAQMGNRFDQWNYHQEGCDCFICYHNQEGLLKPDGFFENTASEIMGGPVSISTLEWARYSAGDFYGPRNLTGNQKGFMLILNEDWNPMWGGNLVDIDEFTVLPTSYNQLTLFDGTTGITPIIPSVQQSLYCLTGTLVPKLGKS